MPPPRRILPLLLAAILGACAAPPRPPRHIDTVADPRMSEFELRTRVEELASRYTGLVELTAHRIMTDSDDRRLDRMMFNWVIRSNEDVVHALGYGDPLASLIDIWVLALQTRDYLEGQPVPEAWQPFIPRVRETASTLEAEARGLVEQFGGEAATAESLAFVEQWARDNPLRGELSRPSTAPLWAAYRTKVDPTLFSVAASVEQGLHDVADRLDVLNTQLPRQMSWRAALVVNRTIESLEPRIAASFDKGLDDVAAVVDAQRHEVLEAVDAMRLETVVEVECMVAAAAAEVARQRLDSHQRIDTLVADAINAIDQQRAAAVGEIASVAETAVDDAFARTERIVELLFRRALALLGAAFAAALVLVLLGAVRRRPPGSAVSLTPGRARPGMAR